MRKLVAPMLVTAVAVMASVGLAGPAAASESGAFVAQINSVRSSRGLAALETHGQLTSVAQAWAEQMAAAGGISHNPSLASQVSGDWTVLGENVGVGTTVDGLMQAFIDSPGHYANLVEPRYTHVGVGVTWGADGRMYTAHVFMALPAPAPPPPPPPAAAAESSPQAEQAPRSVPSAEQTAGPAAQAASPAPPALPAPPAEPARVAAVLVALRSLGV